MFKRFPYSRHSSYAELCELVAAFKPRDIFPCTVDPNTWSDAVSMRNLFGHLCSGDEFLHDRHMRDTVSEGRLRPKKRRRLASSFSQASRSPSSSVIGDDSCPAAAHPTRLDCGTASTAMINPMDNRQSSAIVEREDSPSCPRSTALHHGGEGSEFMRNRIRSIRDCLETMKDQMLFSNGPLPTALHAEGDDLEQASHPEQIQDSAHPASQSGGASPASRLCMTTTGEASQVSLPDSAFDSQDQEDPTLTIDLRHTIAEPNTSGRCSRSVSVQQRKIAYLAARARTYDAWSQVALLSAGNNHTEEEVEL
jgi:DNA cross-link repair 1C protein